MAAITATPITVSYRDEGFLSAGISASATTITVAPIYKYPSGTKTKQGFDSTTGFAEISLGSITEVISFGAASVDGSTKVTTLTDVRRGLSQTGTTAVFTAGTGRTWAKGARIRVVDYPIYIQNGAFTDKANTFSATQTITAPLLVTGTTSFTGVPSMTTAQRTSLTPSQPGFVYDTDLGQFYKYEAGAWAAVDTGTFSNAANNTAGKVDLATAAEVAAGTANDATSTAPNVIPVSIVKTSSTGAVNGTVPALNAAVSLDVTIGGTGRTSVTSGALLVGAGTSAMTVIGPGSANQLPTSNGTTIAMADPKYYDRTVFTSAADSTTLTNPTTATIFDTHQYTIPANDLVAGVVYEFEAVITFVHGTAGEKNLTIFLGGATLGDANIASQSGTRSVYFKGFVMGTAAAGAAAAVRAGSMAVAAEGTGICGMDFSSNNKATNGTLVLGFGTWFGTSDGGNTAVVKMSRITKRFTTSF